MSTPSWFSEAIATVPDHRHIDVDGVRIAYRAWGREGDPVTVLVHGGAAHAGWWDHVGPHLVGSAAGERVVALDLSGHGDSEHADTYSLEAWAAQVVAVAAAETTDATRPVVLGHSMGGFVALTTARDHGHRLAGVAALDSPVREMSAETRAWIEAGRGVPPNKVYPDLDTILSRFRTLPADDASLDYVRDHLARGSVVQTAEGWTWKFDPRIFFRSRMEPEELADAACPVALLRGDRGMASRDITDVVAQRLGGHVPVTVVRDSGHHLMLDQPVALVAALQALVGEWRRP